MFIKTLVACSPFLALIALSVIVLWLLLRLSGSYLQIAQIRNLHHDEVGGVQTLSFVLTFPFFIFVMMFIVQLSQITIAQVAIEYSAFAAARSAVVWIPAYVNVEEAENRISTLEFLRAEYGETDGDSSPTQNFSQGMDVYRVEPTGPKYEKIRQAAVQALLPICPSRPIVTTGQQSGELELAAVLEKAYQLSVPTSESNPSIGPRLRNKLSYGLANTTLEITIRHKHSEPPLWYTFKNGARAFAYNEIGWQDTITCEVQHDFALLPGPGRLLARRADASPGTSPEANYGNLDDPVRNNIKTRQGTTYVYSLTSSVRMTNEGLQSVKRLDDSGLPQGAAFP